jgi:hypothetical protein
LGWCLTPPNFFFYFKTRPEMAKFNKKATPEQSYFVPVGTIEALIFQGGSYALTLGYVDITGAIKDNTLLSKEAGRYIEYVQSKDKLGRDNPKRFKFDQSVGRFMTRPSDRDINGKSQYDFLKNHPECEASPNGQYETDSEGNVFQTGVTFREVNAAKDAASALKIDRLKNEAETKALNLDERSLEEVANIVGYFGDVDEMMMLKVVEYARHKPSVFLDVLKDGDRTVLATIRRGISEGVIKKNGPVYKYEGLTLGVNEDEAVVVLKRSTEVLKALQKKFGFAPAE